MVNMKPILGRLETVELRNYWKDEARDFTPWLAEDDNINLLGETVGMELEVQEKEAKGTLPTKKLHHS